MKNQRDTFIDVFKGILILWVINIHTIVWSGDSYISDNIQQLFLLMDVPVFFFISGYLTKSSNFLSSLKKSLRQFLSLYYRYVFISLVLIIFISLGYLILKYLEITLFEIINIPVKNILFTKNHFNLNDVFSAIISMLKLRPNSEFWLYTTLGCYDYNLWYLRTYLLVLPFLGIALYVMRSFKRKFILILSPLLVFYFLWYLEINQIVHFKKTIFFGLFYLFICLLGAFYKQQELRINLRYLIFSFLLNIILIYPVFLIDNGRILIQAHKFPPSFLYLIYSLIPIHIFIILKHIWKYPRKKRIRKIVRCFEWCGQNVYPIYILQSVVCSLPIRLTTHIHNYVPNFLLYFLVLTFNLSITLLVVQQYLRFESLCMNLSNTITSIKFYNYLKK